METNPFEHRVITTRSDFNQTVLALAEALASSGCRELWFSDVDFIDWPLSEPAFIEHLSRWALPHGKLVVLAAQFDGLARRHPRWVAFRRQWSHVVECRTVQESDIPRIPCLLLAPPLAVLRLHGTQPLRGVVSSDASDAVRTADELDAYLQRSTEAFPASTLGL